MARFRFVHAADIHLGYQQYNLDQRADDFARAYFEMVEYARDENVDFVLIAGDLFHRSSADAWMLKQATHGLQALRDAGIPVIAVEGNHDTQHTRKNLSWMEFLGDGDLLRLLNVETGKNNYRTLVPFDPVDRRGSWLDVAGARVYGMKYFGAATARILELVRDEIEPGPEGYTIFMLHAGMEGQVPHMHGGLTMGQIAPLRPAVDYLALGHVHKRLQLDDWVYNPGSTETISMEEMDWPHGFFDVQVDTSGSPKHVVTPIATPSLRPFFRISVLAEGDETLEAFTELAERVISAERSIPAGAVVELQLGGIAAFRRQDLPVERLKGTIQTRFSPLIVRIRNALVPPGLAPVRHGERLRRAELERSVVEQLVYQHADYRDRAALWTSLILDVKNMAATREMAPAAIADVIGDALARVAAPEEALGLPEPEGGEPPCLAPLFEDW